jgi:hypothetical protein
MSQENVEIVRAGIEAFNRRDWDAVLEHAAPDFALDMSRAIGLEQRGIYTVDQLRSFLEDLGGPFESHRIEAEDRSIAAEHRVKDSPPIRWSILHSIEKFR